MKIPEGIEDKHYDNFSMIIFHSCSSACELYFALFSFSACELLNKSEKLS